MYVHEFIHNNLMDKAYMRSGNLPGRYEVVNTGTPTYVPRMMHWGTSVIIDGQMDDDRAFFFTMSGKALSYGNGDAYSIDITYTTTKVVTKLDITTGASVSTYSG